MPGLRPLCKQLWFLQLREQYQYNEFKQNNLMLEDEAILCGLKNKKQKMESDDGKINFNFLLYLQQLVIITFDFLFICRRNSIRIIIFVKFI